MCLSRILVLYLFPLRLRSCDRLRLCKLCGINIRIIASVSLCSIYNVFWHPCGARDMQRCLVANHGAKANRPRRGAQHADSAHKWPESLTSWRGNLCQAYSNLALDIRSSPVLCFAPEGQRTLRLHLLKHFTLSAGSKETIFCRNILRLKFFGRLRDLDCDTRAIAPVQVEVSRQWTLNFETLREKKISPGGPIKDLRFKVLLM